MQTITWEDHQAFVAKAQIDTERETIERCARECVRRSEVELSSNRTSEALAAADCANAIRGLAVSSQIPMNWDGCIRAVKALWINDRQDEDKVIGYNHGLFDAGKAIRSLHKASSALNAASFKECRHCGWECRPNQAQSHKWYPLNDPTSSHPSPLLAEPLVQTVQCKAVPDGFALVPIEPTDEMREAGRVADYEADLIELQQNKVMTRADCAAAIYRAMIAAAPKPLAPEGE